MYGRQKDSLFILAEIQRRNNRIAKDIGFYTSAIPYTSLHPTPLECRHKEVLDLTWINILFQNHFCGCQVHIEMRLGPIKNLPQWPSMSHSAFCIVNIKMYGIFINSRCFVSRRFQCNCTLLLVILAIQFTVSSNPYLQEYLPYRIHGFPHPKVWVMRFSRLVDLEVLSYARFPL